MAADPAPRGRAKSGIGGDLILPGLALAFAAYFFASVWPLAWEAKANATIVGLTLIGLIAILGVRAGAQVLAGRADLRLGPLLAPWHVMPARIAVVLLTALFIAALPWLGLTLGLFALVAAQMLVLRVGSLRTILLAAGVIAASAYGLFIALLNSRLPRGPVEALLSGLF